MDAFIPSPQLLAFEKLTVSGLEMTIEAKTTRTVVHCPECQQPTQKVHSSYRRRPRDLPTAGLSVRLLLQTRKFFCENSDCSRVRWTSTSLAHMADQLWNSSLRP